MTLRSLRPLRGPSLFLCALLAWAPPARAASMELEVDVIDEAAADIGARTTSLELETRPGAYLSDLEAITRFQDYLFLHLIGENQSAAEGFFALVTTGTLTDAGLHRDAEWYLAETLFALGNYRTAAARFQVLVDDPQHPFRSDAVRRLLEVHAQSGDTAAFRSLYDQEIVPGKVKPTGLITYSLAKDFYRQRDLASARSYFDRVESGGEMYGRARYFLGVIDVTEGNLDLARTHFQEVVALSIETTEDRLVHDQALLALGRIAYHTADYTAAAESYNAIGGDSAYQADKLYEIVWTSIRRQRWRDALNNVEIFLLAFPDHEFAARLRLLEGHLNFQETNWPEALGAYEQVIADYAPVQVRFAMLAREGSDADAAVQQVLEANTSGGDLPAYAVALMRTDPDLARSMDVFNDLDEQRKDIEISERLIAELRLFIEGSGAIGSFERVSTESHIERSRSIDQRLALLEIEERWLGSLGDSSVSAKIPGLSQRRQALVERHGAVSAQARAAGATLTDFERSVGDLAAEADNARRELADHENALQVARASLANAEVGARDAIIARVAQLEVDAGDARARIDDTDRKIAAIQAPDSSKTVDSALPAELASDVVTLVSDFRNARPVRPGLTLADRLDTAHRALDDSFARLGLVLDAVVRTEDSEVGAIRARFAEEVAAVAVERQDHADTLGQARTVSLALTRAGFGRLEDFFADSILKADMGIVDVYWAQKLERDDELNRVREEQKAQMADLERRFKLIRDKLGEAPR